jgi:hypothetical protein
VKRIGLTFFAAAVLALPLCAQVTTLRADIPFEFSARNTTAAPGEYVITVRPGSPVVEFEGSQHYYVLANQGSGSASSQGPKLVFNRYGNQYFLSRISTASVGRDLPPSRTERELMKTAAATGQVPREIVLAMR